MHIPDRLQPEPLRTRRRYGTPVKGLCVLTVVTGLTFRSHGELPVPAYALSQFGSLATTAATESAFTNAAAQIIAAGGGLLVVPSGTPAAWVPENNSQGIWLKPGAPAPSKGWGKGPGLTVVDYRTGTLKISPPQVTGMEVNRVLDLLPGQSLPHWDYQPMVQLNNAVLNGSNSYRDWLQEDVKAGKAQRFYVRTIRGLFPGAFMNSGDYGSVQRLYLQSLGYDREKQMWFFLADTDADIKKGALIHNKNHVNTVRADTWSHNENQTFDVMVWRHNYSQGDNYLVDGRFTYMSDVHSTAGDENGVIYAAFVQSDSAIFRGMVESWNPATGELVYKPGAKADTLGSGRPLINLNPAKWIASGKAWVNQPGGALLGWGGAVKSRDPSWTADLAGRYFAVDEAGEYVPGGDKVRRWWPITGFSVDADGVKCLSIQRHWWGAKDGHSIGRLYQAGNYTTDDKTPRLLSYIIAPGVNVYDVSQGVSSAQVNPNGCPRLLKLAPAPFAGSAFDYAAGDPVEQAIGPDPFKPIPFRSWLWDAVPGIFNAPVFDIANRGVQRHAVMTVGGGGGDLAENRTTRYDGNPPFTVMLRFLAASRQGLRFEGDTAGAALLFMQPHLTNGRPQVIHWSGLVARQLGVESNGCLNFSPGAPLDLAGHGIADASGLAGQATRSSNLRGIHIPVAKGESRAIISFPTSQPDAAYALVIRPSWPADHAISKQTSAGFEVLFDSPAPDGAVLDWVLVQ